MYSRSVVGERGLRPSTWHRFLLQYLPHILRRENQRRPRMMMGWRGWRGYTRAVQLTSPVALELDGTSAAGGGPSTTPSESEPWWPPSTHDCGAGQETAPLVGPRGEAVRTLLGQQASSFALPIFAETLVAPSRATPSRLRGRLHRLSLRQSGYARCHVSLGARMNHYHWNVSGRQPVAVHERPLTTDGVASFRTAPSSRAHRPRAGAHASERACHEFARRVRALRATLLSHNALFSLARAGSCPLSFAGPCRAGLYHWRITLSLSLSLHDACYVS